MYEILIEHEYGATLHQKNGEIAQYGNKNKCLKDAIALRDEYHALTDRPPIISIIERMRITLGMR